MDSLEDGGGGKGGAEEGTEDVDPAGNGEALGSEETEPAAAGAPVSLGLDAAQAMPQIATIQGKIKLGIGESRTVGAIVSGKRHGFQRFFRVRRRTFLRMLHFSVSWDAALSSSADRPTRSPIDL